MVKFENVAGLTDKEVEESRAKHGSNYLPPPEVESIWDKLKDNFEDPLIRILLVALSITLGLAFLGYADWLEGFGIALAVFLAAFVSTYSEYKNESSFRDLQEKASKIQNTVFRNNIPVTISSADIVVGDYVLLQAGDKIPADGKLVFGELQVNQETLNGEAVPVSKVVAPNNYEAADKSDFLDRYLCFKATVVDDGEGVMRVDTVGVETFYGKLHTELADNEDRESPLQVKLSDLADGVARFGYIGATAIAISFLFKQFVIDNKYDYNAILSYVSLNNWQAAFHDVVTSVILAIIVIVVAVPEGLPMMIAIVLSLNMRKLLKANVLVRKLLGIEAAGSINILFVDKTGTLTKGKFEPQMFLDGNGTSYPRISNIPDALSKIVVFSIRESTSAVLGDKGVILGGNASDRALLSYITLENVQKSSDTHLVKEILFNSARKFSASQLRVPKGKLSFIKGEHITLVKGAPELLLPNCNTCYHDDGSVGHLDNEKLGREINNVSKNGIRVIAIATSEEAIEDHLPQKLTLVGVVGIKDEVRAESKGAIELANRAGIQVVMVTGDRKETAVAVAEELSLVSSSKQVLTSSQLKTMSDEELKAAIPNIAVISRALPTDKSRLVRVCQEMNQVVGMTGDGVNDSAALKKADVGFAMGSGSEVAKEASSIVILDDNFTSITQAVLYGRTIFKSIRKFIVFQSTVNCASMLIVFAGPFLGFDFPLTLIQLLWVNLVMDTLAALAFGGEPALKLYMHESPIRRDEKIITSNMWSSILTNGVFIATLCTLVLRSPTVRGLFTRDGVVREDVFLTSFFAFFIFLTAFNAFNVRTPSNFNIFKHIFENSGFLTVMILIFAVQVTFTYVGGRFLRTVGLTPNEWALVIGASAVIIPFDLARKFVMKIVSPPKKNDFRVKEN